MLEHGNDRRRAGFFVGIQAVQETVRSNDVGIDLWLCWVASRSCWCVVVCTSFSFGYIVPCIFMGPL